MSDHAKPDRLCFRAMYGQERDSDVEFEVGPEGAQTWRFTAHKRVLAASSPVMKSLFYGPNSHHSSEWPVPIRVPDIDPRAFQCLLRFLYGLPPQLQTVATALATLYAAHKYLCAGLEWECAAFLNEQVQLKPDYVLDILQAVAFFCTRGDQYGPTAPPAEEVESDSEGARLVGIEPRRNSGVSCHSSPRRGSVPEPPLGEASVRLRHNCLQVVDHNADLVLPLEQVGDLDHDTLLAMMSRDTLAVSSELVVFQAAERWAECECKRLKLPHASPHLRQVLGGPHVVCGGQLARLLLLTPQQFAEGPARSLLLSSEEQKCILVHLVGCSAGELPKQAPSSPQHVAWRLLATPRVSGTPHYLPIPSAQLISGGPCEPTCKSGTKLRHWGLRWPRNKRKENKREKEKREKEKKEKQEPQRPGCCSRTCEIFISVIACLFD